MAFRNHLLVGLFAIVIVGIGLAVAYAFIQLARYVVGSVPPLVALVGALVASFSIFDALALLINYTRNSN